MDAFALDLIARNPFPTGRWDSTRWRASRCSALEWAIRVAASFAEGWISQGAKVELLHGEGSIPDPGGSIKTRTTTVLDALARLTPGNSQDLACSLSSPRYQGSSREVRVVVTTDLGLQGLATQGWRRPEDRFVVLRAGAFASQLIASDPVSLCLVPWVLIDGPDHIDSNLRLVGREVAVGS